MFATEPLTHGVATTPGAPQLPPSLQAREPGGLEIALAIRPPIGVVGPGGAAGADAEELDVLCGAEPAAAAATSPATIRRRRIMKASSKER